ncbi:MAG: hypothetical protein IPM82_21505 [Saprospiraceae bacterium]|nr:hypothetical protein [Saprospiraceae bacterium]
MKKILRHITIYLLASTVFVATTGLSVHHLYCYCKGEMVTSLFRPDEPCELSEKQSPATNCCTGSSCGKMDGEKKHNCADCTSIFVKLDAKYLPSFFDLKLQAFFAPQTANFTQPSFIVLVKNALRWQQDLPPPPAGKELLPWIQSYLC